MGNLWIEGNFYKLSNGNYIRVYNMCDDPECDYGYDYFNGETKRLIDGGVFNLEEGQEETAKEVLETAMKWCDIDTREVTAELVSTDIGYSDLEEKGYTGF